jgi:branched-subunit amino acid transport protein
VRIFGPWPLLREQGARAPAFTPPGLLWIDPGNAKLIAAPVAGIVAWWRQSAVLTIGSGMAVLWALQYVMS